jgi:hypothetical protein
MLSIHFLVFSLLFYVESLVYGIFNLNSMFYSIRVQFLNVYDIKQNWVFLFLIPKLNFISNMKICAFN